MTLTLRGSCIVAVALMLPGLVSCTSILPGDGPSLLADRTPIDSGPSGQRRGRDGYPLIGAYPNAAAPQVADETVAEGTAGLQAAASTQASTASVAGPNYQQSVASMQRLRAERTAEVEAAIAETRPPAAGARATTPEDVLREIENR